MKRVLKIILWILVAATLGAGIYLGWQYLFGRGVPPSVPGTVGETPEESLKPKILSDNPIFDYWLNKNSGDVYYLTPEGNIYKITSTGENQDTGSKATGNLSYIKPSNDGSSVLVSFGYPQNPTFAIYNSGAKTWQALPAGTTAAAWNPLSNNRLVYLKDNGTIGKLYFFTISNSKSIEVARITQKDLDLDWVLPDVIYLRERLSGRHTSSLWSYNLTTKTFGVLVREEVGPMIKWSPDGATGLRWLGNLSVIDKNNRILSNLDLKTIPSKCAFSRVAIYCAAPNDQINLPANAFPNQYLQRAVNFNDDLYLLLPVKDKDFSDLAKIRLLNAAFSGIAIDADRLEIQNNRLLFINRLDGKLYSLEL